MYLWLIRSSWSWRDGAWVFGLHEWFFNIFIWDLFSFSLNLCLLAPEMAPCFAQCICCTFPKYILDQIEASKYIILRENSMGWWNQFSLFLMTHSFFQLLEWNAPLMINAEGMWCGQSLCLFRVYDQIQVLYYDDPLLDRITNRTRCCNGVQFWSFKFHLQPPSLSNCY